MDAPITALLNIQLRSSWVKWSHQLARENLPNVWLLAGPGKPDRIEARVNLKQNWERADTYKIKQPLGTPSLDGECKWIYPSHTHELKTCTVFEILLKMDVPQSDGAATNYGEPTTYKKRGGAYSKSIYSISGFSSVVWSHCWFPRYSLKSLAMVISREISFLDKVLAWSTNHSAKKVSWLADNSEIPSQV